MHAVDSFGTVANWLSRHEDPRQGDIAEIRSALQDIHERLMKVRCISPTTDLTERMWVLMGRAGFKVRLSRQRTQ